MRKGILRIALETGVDRCGDSPRGIPGPTLQNKRSPVDRFPQHLIEIRDEEGKEWKRWLKTTGEGP